MDFQLRPFKSNDAKSLSQYANNKKVSDNLTNGFPFPYTMAHAHAFIKMASSFVPCQIMAITIGDQVVGGIGLHKQEDVYFKNMELGYWLAEPFWGRGIMTAAIREMVRYGFETFDINRIFARPYGYNEGSKRVLEKSGFEQEAFLKETFFKNGAYVDEYIYGIRRGTS